MFLKDYLWFLLAILLCMGLAVYASARVKNTFAKFDRIHLRSGLTGHDAAMRLLRASGIGDIAIGQVEGTLTDHYHPQKKIVNLSESTYGSASVAAVAVAAHEIGHVMQNKNSYLFYRLRTALVPAVNFGSKLAMPLVLLGILLDSFLLAADSDLGFYLAMAGVILYGGTFLFALVTLPVEWDASRRAKKMLLKERILTEEEATGAAEVLSAAALTYLASMLTSLVYFLRFLFYVLSIFGRRNRR